MLNIALFQNIAAMGAGAVAPTTAFDPSVSNSSLLFTNSNLTVETPDNTTRRMARVGDAKSKVVGSYTGSFTITINRCDNLVEIGLVDKSVNITAVGFLDSTNKALSYSSNGVVSYSGGYPGGSPVTYAGYATGDVMTVKIVNNLVGFAKNGTWQGSFNPTTGAGGIDISVATNGSADGSSNVVPAVGLLDTKATGDFSGW